MSRNAHFDAGAGAEYRGVHTAPGPDSPQAEGSSAFHNPEQVMPDVHEHPEYYEYMDPPSEGRETHQQLQAARGKPDHPVHIYRAVPHGIKVINPGDWVTSSRKYAEQHAMQSEDAKDDWPVIHAIAPAKHLNTAGEVHEWGFNGPKALRAT